MPSAKGFYKHHHAHHHKPFNVTTVKLTATEGKNSEALPCH